MAPDGFQTVAASPVAAVDFDGLAACRLIDFVLAFAAPQHSFASARFVKIGDTNPNDNKTDNAELRIHALQVLIP